MSTVKSPSAVLELRLYIAGATPNSVRAMANAQAICQEHFPGSYSLEVIDVQWHARRATADGVIVTPTLVKLRPLPARHVVGDLSDTASVLSALSGKCTP